MRYGTGTDAKIKELVKPFNANFQELVINITKRYNDVLDGHGRDHICNVLRRTIELCGEYYLEDKQTEIAVLGAVCHDLGLNNGPRKNHHYRSAAQVLTDEALCHYLKNNAYDILSVVKCCVYHRASASSGQYELSIEAKVVADADNDITIDDVIKRCVEVNMYDLIESIYEGEEKRYSDNSPLVIKRVDDIVVHIKEKFTREGYVKFYLPRPHEIVSRLNARFHLFENEALTRFCVVEATRKYLDSCGTTWNDYVVTIPG